MSLKLLALTLLVAACFEGCGGDHYEGGGRRRQLPTSSSAMQPNIGPGDGSSTMGGTTPGDENGAGAGMGGYAGAFGLPQGGAP